MLQKSVLHRVSKNVNAFHTEDKFDYDNFLLMTSKQDAPFVMKVKNEDGSLSYEGYCIDLLNELARNLKFTYEIYTVPDGKYGGLTENGSWNGMVGEIVKEVYNMLYQCDVYDRRNYLTALFLGLDYINSATCLPHSHPPPPSGGCRGGARK